MVRKPPCAFHFLTEYNMFLSICFFWIFWFIKEVHLAGWSWQLGCVYLTFEFTEKTSMCMSMIFQPQGECVSRGRSASGGSCESFQELLSWWPWVPQNLGSRSWCPRRKPRGTVLGAAAAAEKNDNFFSTRIPGPAFCANLRSRNEHEHVTRGILCRNSRGKFRTLPIPPRLNTGP